MSPLFQSRFGATRRHPTEPRATASGTGAAITSSPFGDQIKVDGYMAKDGSKMANTRNVVFADGRTVFSGSSGDGGPAQ
jgi:hypothetical protein